MLRDLWWETTEGNWRQMVDFGERRTKCRRMMKMPLIIRPHCLAKERLCIQPDIEDDEDWTKPALPLRQPQEIQKVLRWALCS